MAEIRGAAVVGLGIGTMHVRALRRLRDRFAVVAVCDPDASRSEAVADRIGAVQCSFEDAIARDDVDVVHICTPPTLHFEQCSAALAAGKHVVCEKPVVGSLAAVDRLAAVEAESAGRYHPATAHWAAPDGSVGWLRLRHRGRVSATAAPRELTVLVHDDDRHGREPVVVEAATDGEFEPQRWTFPGCVVTYDGPPADASGRIDAGDGDALRLRFDAG